MHIGDSVERILADKDILGEKFYEIFFTRHPDVKKFFEGVKIPRQAVLLTTALALIERNYEKPSPAITEYLHYLGTKHHGWQISRELYVPWTDAMLETLSKFHGSDWNAELQRQWREAIGKAVELMLEGYEAHYHV
jgi:hemoglobin-like flavoprotein